MSLSTSTGIDKARKFWIEERALSTKAAWIKNLEFFMIFMNLDKT